MKRYLIIILILLVSCLDKNTTTISKSDLMGTWVSNEDAPDKWIVNIHLDFLIISYHYKNDSNKSNIDYWFYEYEIKNNIVRMIELDTNGMIMTNEDDFIHIFSNNIITLIRPNYKDLNYNNPLVLFKKDYLRGFIYE